MKTWPLLFALFYALIPPAADARSVHRPNPTLNEQALMLPGNPPG